MAQWIMVKNRFIIPVIVFSFVLFASPAFGATEKLVLGNQDSAPSIPPTVEGPGFVLPDSPLYILDHLKQNLRLFVAWNPETKAKVHASIAGERLAELRIMLDRENEFGIETSLDGIAGNFQKAAEELHNAQLAGRNVTAIATEVNASIKEKQQSLDILEKEANGGLAFQVKGTQKELLIAKIQVEENLPQHELENEIRDDIQRVIATEVNNTVQAARNLELELQALEAQMDASSHNALTRREEAVRQAIAEKNDELRKTNEQLLARETEKQKLLKAVQKTAAEQARLAIQEAQKAATNLERAQRTFNTIKNTNVETTAVAGATDTKNVTPDNKYPGITATR